MHLNYTIDWLTFTVEGCRSPKELRELAAKMFWGASAIDGKHSNGYRWAVVTIDGAILQSGERLDMHTNVICSGDTLSQYSSMFAHSDDWLSELLQSARNVSRIDLAIDVHGCNMLDALISLTKVGAHKCMARTYKIVESQGEGRTLYLGDRSSERMMRIYDKRAQTGLDGDAWTRLELEVKGDAAKRCAKSIQQSGLFRVCKSWITAFVEYPIKSWDEIVSSTEALYTPSQRKLADTRQWLLGTVAPIVAKRIIKGDVTILEDFNKQVTGIL